MKHRGGKITRWTMKHFTDIGLGRLIFSLPVCLSCGAVCVLMAKAVVEDMENGIFRSLPSGLVVVLFFGFCFWQLANVAYASFDTPFPCGQCSNCGYDLTGNVSGVCPECGNRVKA